KHKFDTAVRLAATRARVVFESQCLLVFWPVDESRMIANGATIAVARRRAVIFQLRWTEGLGDRPIATLFVLSAIVYWHLRARGTDPLSALPRGQGQFHFCARRADDGTARAIGGGGRISSAHTSGISGFRSPGGVPRAHLDRHRPQRRGRRLRA